MGNREDQSKPPAGDDRLQVFWSYPNDVREQAETPVSEPGLGVS
jgi:hypothetical protein